MADTRYLPADWLDEISPETQPKPEAFVSYDEVNGWHLKPVGEDDYVLEDEEQTYIITLSAGETVPFILTESYGDFSAVVIDGFATAATPVPEKANCFWSLEHDDFSASSIQEMVEEIGLINGEISFEAYWWPEGPHLFEFAVNDGVPSFIERGAVQ